jgi:hypothetical protein
VAIDGTASSSALTSGTPRTPEVRETMGNKIDVFEESVHLRDSSMSSSTGGDVESEDEDWQSYSHRSRSSSSSSSSASTTNGM